MPWMAGMPEPAIKRICRFSDEEKLSRVKFMALSVEHWNLENDGELSELSMRKKLESRGYRVTRYVYPPGTRFPDHSHDVDKIDAVLSGRFLMRMDGHSVVLQAGDALAVSRGAVHSAEVVGNQAVISLDAIKY